MGSRKGWEVIKLTTQEPDLGNASVGIGYIIFTNLYFLYFHNYNVFNSSSITRRFFLLVKEFIMKKNKLTVRVVAEIAIFAALAFALDAIQGGIFKGVFLSGGSIGFGMLPILIIAYRRGLVPGILCGFIVSIVQMLGGIYVINASSFDNGFLQVMGPFLQIMLDYVLAYTVVGFAGLFSNQFKNATSKKQKIGFVILGTAVGGLLKYACHVIAGGVFWLNNGSSFLGLADDSWIYSFVYNGAYCIPNIIICGIVMVLLVAYYDKVLFPEDLNEAVKEN